MSEIIVMPKLSDTMEEGVIAKWAKAEGELVKEGELLAEIETDKATMEYESPASGTLLKILVPNGRKVKIKEPIGVVGKPGEKFSVTPRGEGKEKAGQLPEERGGKLNVVPTDSPTRSNRPTNPGAADRLKTSPLARKIADDAGIDLTKISGSGPGGRIIARDVMAPLKHGEESNSNADDDLVPTSMMRQTIAKRLVSAKNEAPHFYLKLSVNTAAIDEWRNKLNSEVKNNTTVTKISVNDIVLLAVSRALKKHKEVNASWEGEVIRHYGKVHVSIAVAVPQGLITPVIRDTDQLGVRQIAKASQELVAKAKAQQLKPEDYTGGTFTVSNLGMFGIEEFTAIINPPQAAILAVGSIQNVVTVNEKNEFVIQPRMRITLSCDHRVVDGATGARFLNTVQRYLEEPTLMLE